MRLQIKLTWFEEIFEEYEFQSIYELESLLTRLCTKRELLGSLIHHFTYLKEISLPHSQL
ncbi:hypothetical protein B7693_02855 [Streptococcus mitis]|uniref:Uncharacterized protein n=1 Tax=Streptococcus mitis TaxID=28037 RepID=A0A1X1KWY6_STRMT|nr:hypothetical protein B7693_02855 [Streptococcus mitis]